MQQPCRFYADAKFIDAIFEFPAGKCIAVVPHGIERLRDILAAETGGVQFDPEVVVLHAQIARVVRITADCLICLSPDHARCVAEGRSRDKISVFRKQNGVALPPCAVLVKISHCRADNGDIRRRVENGRFLFESGRHGHIVAVLPRDIGSIRDRKAPVQRVIQAHVLLIFQKRDSLGICTPVPLRDLIRRVA